MKDGPTYHFSDRFAFKLDYNVSLDTEKEQDVNVTQNEVKFKDYTLRPLSMPDVRLIARYMSHAYGITNKNDLQTVVIEKLKTLKKDAPKILNNRELLWSYSFKYLFG